MKNIRWLLLGAFPEGCCSGCHFLCELPVAMMSMNTASRENLQQQRRRMKLKAAVGGAGTPTGSSWLINN